MMLTINHLAHKLNLSTATVSRALSGKAGVGNKTATRVKALAEELGYCPNTLAASLRKGRSQTLGVIVPHLDSNFFSRVVQGIEQAATEAGYRLLICQSHDDSEHERKALTRLQNAQVEGILIAVASTTQEFAVFEQIKQQGIPILFFDRFLEGSNVNAVVVDDRAGAYDATQHLLAQGYRRIAHLAGPQHLSSYKNRRLGYQDALRAAGHAVEKELIIYSNLKLEDGMRAATHLLAMPQPPDAFCAAGDFAALGCLRVLQEKGYRVPAEAGVIGFSNEFFCQHTEPALSSVEQQSERLGCVAVQQLLEMKEAWPPAVAYHVMIQPKLQVQASSLRDLNAPLAIEAPHCYRNTVASQLIEKPVHNFFNTIN